MSSMMGSQGVVLATAMVVSSTVIFLAFSKQRNFPPTAQFSQPDSQTTTLRSCLNSGKKRDKKSKKRVRFAENVKEPSGNGEEYRREQYLRQLSELERRSCRSEIAGAGGRGMPANRAALYSGILRDRVHRIECSH